MRVLGKGTLQDLGLFRRWMQLKDNCSIHAGSVFYRRRFVNVAGFTQPNPPKERNACFLPMSEVRGIHRTGFDEVIGLAAGFLQVGVAGVIASLWSVDDRASSALMIRFAELYLNPQNTWSLARALAEAQRWLREEATNRVLAGGDGEDGMRTSYAARSTQSPNEEPHSEDPDALPFADPRYWAAFVVTGG
jgi:hypothetical protein